MKRTVVADAEVTITVKLSNVGSWGESCDVAQVLRQAEEVALSQAKRIVLGSNVDISVDKITFRERK